MSEKFTNFATSTLSSTINNSTTSLTVASASSFPSTGNFRILVQNEIMLVTARAGNVFTVTRGAESSSAVSHNAGVVVSHILTAGGFTQAVSENEGDPGYLPSSIPSLNGYSSSSFTQVNVGSATITDYTDRINIRMPPATGSNWDVAVLHRALTSTMTMAFTMSTMGTGSFAEPSVGLGLYHTGEVCFESYQIQCLSSFCMCTNANRWTNPTTSNGPILGQVACGVSDVWWLRLTTAGSFFDFWISNDGVHFVKALSLLKVSGSLFASPPPDRVAITIHNHNNTSHPLVVNILNWSE